MSSSSTMITTRSISDYPAAFDASSSASDVNSGLSVGAKAGIGVGVAVVVLLIVGLGMAAWVFHRRLGNARKSGADNADLPPSDVRCGTSRVIRSCRRWRQI